MITIYHSPRSRSLRVLWALEEMGLEYETAVGSVRDPTPEFRAVNPSLTLPAMVDGDVVITESVAILLYLAERHGPTPLAIRGDEPGFADYCQFLVFGEAGLAAPMNAVVGTRFLAPDDQKENFTVGMVLEGFFRRMRLVERRLEVQPYLAGDRFTLADISVGYTIGLAAGFLGLGDKIAPHVMEWHGKVTARPAFLRAASR